MIHEIFSPFRPLLVLGFVLSSLAHADPKNESPEKMPWESPSYQKDIPATKAISRGEEPGWTLWTKHHENRVRWVAEKEVDLLPIFPRGKDAKDLRRQANEEINEIIKSYVDRKTVHWLDLRPVFLNDDGTLKKELMPDGLHPDKNGFRAWAEAMEPTLKKMLGESS